MGNIDWANTHGTPGKTHISGGVPSSFTGDLANMNDADDDTYYGFNAFNTSPYSTIVYDYFCSWVVPVTITSIRIRWRGQFYAVMGGVTAYRGGGVITNISVRQDGVWNSVATPAVSSKPSTGTLTLTNSPIAEYTENGSWENVTGILFTLSTGSGTEHYQQVYSIEGNGLEWLNSGVFVQETGGKVELGYGQTPTALKVQTPSGVRSLGLVPVDDPFASALRVNTPDGVKAVARTGA